MQIYDPIGVYKAKKEDAKKLKVDLGIILPADENAKNKKFHVVEIKSIDISNGGYNGIFVAVCIESEVEGPREEPLTKPKFPVVNELSLKFEPVEFNQEVEKSHVIVYHDNDFTEESEQEVIEKAKQFVRENDYNTTNRFRYSKPSKNGKVQPETAGGGILVGT